MSIIREQEISVCTLDKLTILSRWLPKGRKEHRVIMTFVDGTQRPDFLTDEGYQTLAGPFKSLRQANRVGQELRQEIAKNGLGSVVNKVIAGEPIVSNLR